MTGPIFDTHAHYSARAFDAVNFMCTDAHQVNFELFDVQRNFSERLNRIDVNERRRIFGLDRLKKLFNRLNRAQFVVDRHHADKNGLFVNRFKERFIGNKSESVNREADDLKALVFKRIKGL